MKAEKPIKRNIGLEILLFLVIAVFGVMTVRYTLIRAEKHIVEQVLQIAKSIEATLPKTDLNLLEAKSNDIVKPQYHLVKNILKAVIRVNPKARFAYLYTERNGKLYFYVDSEPDDSKDCSPPGQEYTEAAPEYKQPFIDGKEAVTPALTDRWGTWISVLIPIRDDATNKVVAVYAMDFNAKAWDNYIVFEVIESILLVVLLLMAFVFLVIIKTNNKLLKDDILKRKQTEDKLRHLTRMHALLSQINQAIVRTREQNALFCAICQISIEFGQFRMAWLGLYDETDNRIKPVAHAGVEEGYLDNILITAGDDSTGNGPTGSAFRKGKVMMSDNIANETQMLPWRDEALKRGYRSSAAIPLRCKGNLVGTLNLYATELGFFTENERKLLEEIGGDISFALDAMASETERLVAEQVGKQLEEDLRKSEEKFRLLITNIRDVVYSINVETKEFEYLSPSFERITGYTLEDIKEMGGRISFLSKVMADGKFAEWDNSFKQLIDKQSNTDFKYEAWWRCKNESYKCLKDHWTPIYANGKWVSIDGLLTDITELKIAEQNIENKNVALQKINAEKDRFFSIIAHDLRSPFNGFVGLTQLLVEELPRLNIEKIHKIATGLKRSATNLYRLLENLLHWAQMQQGLIPFNPEVVQLLPIVTESMAMLQEAANNKGIDMAFDIPDDLNVFADPDMLQTVIRNFVSNAVKFTPNGGVIRLSAKIIEDKGVEISIKDSGIGMSSDMVENLFRIDVQTSRKGTEGESSTGLGLLLCKEFIGKHNGKIWVESEVGKGSIFYFNIPYNAEPI